MTAVVKVFNGSEIKRFAFDKVEDFTHDSLMRILRENMTQVPEGYCLKYVDDEGDLCTLNSWTFEDAFGRLRNCMVACIHHAEAKTEKSERVDTDRKAVTGATSKCPSTCGCMIQHLYVCEKALVPLNDVREAVEELSKVRGKSTVTHAGVECDCCGIEPIQGCRYKCVNCDDFDLCETCFLTPPQVGMREHVARHGFRKISSESGSTPPFMEQLARQGGFEEGSPTETIPTGNIPSTMSPRVGSEWTEVSIGAPHVEGLLRAFGVDVDNTKDAVRKFITSGDFSDIVAGLGRGRRPTTGAQETSGGA